ncbi:sugar ABC transporter permease, partial [Acholeplasma sp. OttesenSCG-928-E16]|nr:sugar ABC transporter permease [Acholeplasma sp. OttesenSCG-928-E16]
PLTGFGNKWSFDNFVGVFTHPNYYFPIALINTMIVVFISVPLSVILALLIAVGLNSIKPLRSFFQTIFFLPYVTNSIAIGMVFAVMFSSTNGLINDLVGQTIVWLDPEINVTSGGGTWQCQTSWFQSMLVLQLYLLWNGLAFKILVFIGALQNVSKQYYDAAKIDSTPKWRVFTRITVPQISPMILYIFITSFIGAFKTYDAVVGIFGNNYRQTFEIQTVVGYIYWKVEEGSNDPESYTLGAAAAVVLFAIIMLFTAIQMKVSKKRVHY